MPMVSNSNWSMDRRRRDQPPLSTMCPPSCHAICLQGTNSKMCRRMAGEVHLTIMMVQGCSNNNNTTNNNNISSTINNSISNNNNSSSTNEGRDLPVQLNNSSFSSCSSKMASELQSFQAHPR